MNITNSIIRPLHKRSFLLLLQRPQNRCRYCTSPDDDRNGLNFIDDFYFGNIENLSVVQVHQEKIQKTIEEPTRLNLVLGDEQASLIDKYYFSGSDQTSSQVTNTLKCEEVENSWSAVVEDYNDLNVVDQQIFQSFSSACHQTELTPQLGQETKKL